MHAASHIHSGIRSKVKVEAKNGLVQVAAKKVTLLISILRCASQEHNVVRSSVQLQDISISFIRL